uniref:RdRp n=1 Tax=Beihai picobirna-like virus 2 TaxID=1922519 RepID=A0A1L3KL80_9VIRU|nr:RdRp [Beihai picobirna-like virus 2]
MTSDIVQIYLGKGVVIAEKVFTTKTGAMPFQNYHTNVGHNTYANDQATLDDGTPIQDYVLSLAKSLDLENMPYLPCVMFGRDQSSGFEYKHDSTGKVTPMEFKPNKASVVTGTSRPGNMHMSKVLFPTISYVQENSFLFSGYLNSDNLKDRMHELLDRTKKEGLVLVNLDFSTFDNTMSPELLHEAHECWKLMVKETNGEGRSIMDAAERWCANMVRLKWLSEAEAKGEGPINLKVDEGGFRYNGLKSGIVTTNFIGGMANALAVTYAQLKLYNDATAMINKLLYKDKFVMGDDDLTWLKSYEDKAHIEEMLLGDLGMVVNPDKGEDGPFFLQNSLNKEGNMVTPSPRVISKCFWVERTKGLGPYAWTMATWMKLYVISENPEYGDVIRLIAEYDEMKLGTLSPEGKRLTASEFASNLKKESEEQDLTTQERLWDGDPQKVGAFDDEGNGHSEWITLMFNDMVEHLGSSDVKS